MPFMCRPQPDYSRMYSRLLPTYSVFQLNSTVYDPHAFNIYHLNKSKNEWIYNQSTFFFVSGPISLYSFLQSTISSHLHFPKPCWSFETQYEQPVLLVIASTATVTLPLRLESLLMMVIPVLLFLYGFPFPPLRFSACWKVKPCLLHPCNP